MKRSRYKPYRTDKTGQAIFVRPELMECISAGDQDAVSEMYDLTSVAVFRLVCRVLGEGSEAEETVHDVYMHVWRKVADFDPARNSPISWLLILAGNHAAGRIHARRCCVSQEEVKNAA